MVDKALSTAISHDREETNNTKLGQRDIANFRSKHRLQQFLHPRRGPYHICSVQDEAITDTPYTLKGIH
jgi:hypothetical protein